MLNAVSRFFDAALVTRVETILARPEALALLAAEQTKAHEQRIADVEQRDRLQRALQAVHDRWLHKLAAAAQKVDRAEQAHDAAVSAQLHLQAEFNAERSHADRLFTTAQVMVYQGSPEAPFFGFRERVNAALRDTQQQSDAVRELCVDGHYRQTWDNRASILRRLDAIGASVHQADELRHLALTPEELGQRFDAIAATWPEVEQRPARFLRPDDADA